MNIPWDFVIIVVLVIVVLMFSPLGKMLEQLFKDGWNQWVDEFADELKIKDDD